MTSNNAQSIETTMVATFDSLSPAETAIESLRVAGFVPDQIGVITSVERFKERFPTYEPPAGPDSWKSAAAAGASAGGVLAGVASTTLLATGAGLPVLLVGGAAGLLTGGVVGGLAGVMTERGLEPDAVDYYEMAVAEGRCLLTVDILRQENAEGRVAEATELLTAAGGNPVRLNGA